MKLSILTYWNWCNPRSDANHDTNYKLLNRIHNLFINWPFWIEVWTINVNYSGTDFVQLLILAYLIAGIQSSLSVFTPLCILSYALENHFITTRLRKIKWILNSIWLSILLWQMILFGWINFQVHWQNWQKAFGH